MLAEIKMGPLLVEYTPKKVEGLITVIVIYAAPDGKESYGILDTFGGTLTNTPDSPIEHLEELGEALGMVSRSLDAEYYRDRLHEMEWTGYCFTHKPGDAVHPLILIVSNDAFVDRGIWKQVTTREAIEAINAIIEDKSVV